MALSPIS
ncbi:hypothetical protein CJF31_00000679 [Rutstroemia sp. NJR-2017a BVV2]|nr:hypothetical protein CJF31_00000679 [Rutstroemia sp. NJR-2017a BVV2]